MTDKQKIIDKIQKLLRLSGSTNEHEAKLAAQRANELMTKHQLSMTQIDVDALERDGIMEQRYEGDTIARKWVPILADACAKLFDGQIYTSGSSTNITFVGFEEDQRAAQELFRHLYDAWHSIVKRDAKAAKAAHESDDEINRPWSGASYRNSHGVGYAHAIYKRVEELITERTQEVSQASQVGTALVVVKGKALADWEAKMNLRKASPARSNSQAGYAAGTAAGKTAALGGAIPGTSA